MVRQQEFFDRLVLARSRLGRPRSPGHRRARSQSQNAFRRRPSPSRSRRFAWAEADIIPRTPAKGRSGKRDHDPHGDGGGTHGRRRALLVAQRRPRKSRRLWLRHQRPGWGGAARTGRWRWCPPVRVRGFRIRHLGWGRGVTCASGCRGQGARVHPWPTFSLPRGPILAPTPLRPTTPTPKSDPSMVATSLRPPLRLRTLLERVDQRTIRYAQEWQEEHIQGPRHAAPPEPADVQAHDILAAPVRRVVTDSSTWSEPSSLGDIFEVTEAFSAASTAAASWTPPPAGTYARQQNQAECVHGRLGSTSSAAANVQRVDYGAPVQRWGSAPTSSDMVFQVSSAAPAAPTPWSAPPSTAWHLCASGPRGQSWRTSICEQRGWLRGRRQELRVLASPVQGPSRSLHPWRFPPPPPSIDLTPIGPHASERELRRVALRRHSICARKGLSGTKRLPLARQGPSRHGSDEHWCNLHGRRDGADPWGPKARGHLWKGRSMEWVQDRDGCGPPDRTERRPACLLTPACRPPTSVDGRPLDVTLRSQTRRTSAGARADASSRNSDALAAGARLRTGGYVGERAALHQSGRCTPCYFHIQGECVYGSRSGSVWGAALHMLVDHRFGTTPIGNLGKEAGALRNRGRIPRKRKNGRNRAKVGLKCAGTS